MAYLWDRLGGTTDNQKAEKKVNQLQQSDWEDESKKSMYYLENDSPFYALIPTCFSDRTVEHFESGTI